MVLKQNQRISNLSVGVGRGVVGKEGEGETWRDVLAEVGMISSSSRIGWYAKHTGPFVNTSMPS